MLMIGQPCNQTGQQTAAVFKLHGFRNPGHIQHEAVAPVGEEIQRLIRRGLNGFHHFILRARLRQILIHHARTHAAQLTIPQAQNSRVFCDRFVFHHWQRRAVVLNQLCASIVTVLVADLGHFPANDVVELLFAFQNALKPRNGFKNRGVFPAKRLNFKPRESLQAHIQNRLRLNLCQSKPRNQLFLRFLRTFAFANQRDHFIQMIDCNH